jgi:hypothetical protein
VKRTSVTVRRVAALVVAYLVAACSAPASSMASSSQFNSGGLAFSYPSTWHATTTNVLLHYEEVVAYLGTGGGSFACGADYIPGAGGTCTEKVLLDPNSLVVKVSAWDGPPARDGGRIAWTLRGDPNATSLTVGGYPAVLEAVTDSGVAADLVLRWTLTMPGSPEGAYEVTAFLKGPDLGASRAQLDALIGSVSLAR